MGDVWVTHECNVATRDDTLLPRPFKDEVILVVSEDEYIILS